MSPLSRQQPALTCPSDAFSKNFIDYEEYPVSADIQNRTYQANRSAQLAKMKQDACP